MRIGITEFQFLFQRAINNGIINGKNQFSRKNCVVTLEQVAEEKRRLLMVGGRRAVVGEGAMIESINAAKGKGNKVVATVIYETILGINLR